VRVTLEGGPADGMQVTPPAWRAGPPENDRLFVTVLGGRAFALGAAPAEVMRHATGLHTYVQVGPALYIHRVRDRQHADAHAR
jgi:hypothetical protein